ncbi:flagellar hook-basal body complex protein FliE [Malonomonas rubra DSM 5091]|uniref:Flagellar hook-basal body complex protein FliE n=1 Tax=Malonomonas rubra DSM 5091 TaxID=1122189 RepID=A0A1M6MDC5_MALRU|nr:flagellar hook-basal body complex protein FliE [Malonomonas rubra]SHJ81426.1 flagellar hook-basal body complex protein FliE [Malonomonas rubra DSM 5091]
MSSIADITLKSHLQSLHGNKVPAAQNIGSKFADALKDSIGQVNQAQLGADRAAEQIAAGETKNLHEAMIKLEEADISLRLMVQVRNKAVEAYQEIMRMQV